MGALNATGRRGEAKNNLHVLLCRLAMFRHGLRYSGQFSEVRHSSTDHRNYARTGSCKEIKIVSTAHPESKQRVEHVLGESTAVNRPQLNFVDSSCIRHQELSNTKPRKDNSSGQRCPVHSPVVTGICSTSRRGSPDPCAFDSIPPPLVLKHSCTLLASVTLPSKDRKRRPRK